MTRQEAEWMRRQDYEASKEVQIAAIKRLRAIGFYTAEHADAELAKLIGRVSFQSTRNANRMSHGAVQHFIPSKDQH